MRNRTTALLLTAALATAACSNPPPSGGRRDSGRTGPGGETDAGTAGLRDSGSIGVDRVRTGPNLGLDAAANICGAIPPQVAAPNTATLLFQLDASGSMNCAPVTQNPQFCSLIPDQNSRWNIFRPNLISALGGLPDETLVGLMYYPDVDDECVPTTPWVDIAPIVENRDILIERLNSGVPRGSTPTHAAVHAAYEVIFQRLLDDPTAPFLVLVTDGQATKCGPACELDCRDDGADQMLIDEVAAAASEHGVRTFVIGVPGSEMFRDVLSRIAIAGETAEAGCTGDACHFDLSQNPENFEQALRDALDRILNEVRISCSFEIPMQDGSFDPRQVDIQLRDADGNIERVRKDGTDGWSYDDETTPTRILLNGAACQRASELVSGRLDVKFGCEPLI